MKVIDMRICSICGREYNAGRGQCDRCDEETPEEALLRKAAAAAGLTEDELIRRELGIDEAERQEAEGR